MICDVESVILDAIASQDRREWLSPDEAHDMTTDVMRALRGAGVLDSLRVF